MNARLKPRWQAGRIAAFDSLAEHLRGEPISATEEDMLRQMWTSGEDARLREDERFARTPWGRWIPADAVLANDRIHQRLQGTPEEGLVLLDVLAALTDNGRRLVFCPADPRFHFHEGKVRLAGLRDLTGEDGREAIIGRLQQAREKLFEAPQPPTAKGGVNAPARLICLSASAGALHLEAGPISSPSAVRTLAVESAGRRWTALASNFRQRPWRVAVGPSTAPYRWTAPGHEDLLDDELAALQVPGLLQDAVTVFRLDAADVGQLLTGTTLTPGQSYRMLLPPTLTPELPSDEMSTLGNGWRLWELTVPDEPSVALAEALTRLGLELASGAIRATWAIEPPIAYRTSASGESLPVFDTARGPILHILAADSCAVGEISLFLLAGNDLQTLSLPAGDRWAISLTDLAPGAYVLDVLHRSTDIAPVRLAFFVGADDRPAVSCHVEVRLGDASAVVSESGEVELQADLAALAPETLQITAPPLWPVALRWEGVRREWLGEIHIEPDGKLGGEAIFERLGVRRHAAVGDLPLDLGELGRVVIRHDRSPTAEDLHSRLMRLASERGDMLAALVGDTTLLRSLWLDPLLEILGYESAQPNANGCLNPPPGCLPLLLCCVRRQGTAIVRQVRAALVLTAGDLGASQVRSYARSLGVHHHALFAIRTDGRNWAKQRLDRDWGGASWDVLALAAPNAAETFGHFLAEFGG